MFFYFGNLCTIQIFFLIGSIHGHQYQESIKHYVTKHLDQLNLKKSAFYSVCLAVASDIEEEHLEAQSIMDDFLTATKWRPDHTIQMAGALRYTQYNYLKRFIMRMIAKKEGADTDDTKDHEYTDWDAVKQFALGLVDTA